MAESDELACAIEFALRHKIVYRATRKALRSLAQGSIEALALDIAGHLLLCGWKHVPRDQGEGHMAGMPPRLMRAGESEPEDGGRS